MMPSPPLADRNDTCCSRWLATGSVHARIKPPVARPASPPSYGKLGNPIVRSPTNPTAIAKPAAATASIQSRNPDPAAKSP